MAKANEKPRGWVPVLGEFEFSPDRVVYVGRWFTPLQAERQSSPDPAPQAAIGVAMSSVAMADGSVQAEVEFETVIDASICELAIAYDVNARHLVTAGLGSQPWAMFGVREFGGPRRRDGWWDHRVAGSRASLRPKTKYALRMELKGALVSLAVDGVAVASAEVTSPQGSARQVGLLCRSESKVTIRNFRAEPVKPRAFVVMQFTGEYDDVYQHVIREVLRDYDVNTLRADEVSGPGLVIADIVKELSAAQLVVADITPTNANVYFEVGYAMALGKPTILFAKKGTPLPFDVAGFRVLRGHDRGKGAPDRRTAEAS